MHLLYTTLLLCIDCGMIKHSSQECFFLCSFHFCHKKTSISIFQEYSMSLTAVTVMYKVF